MIFLCVLYLNTVCFYYTRMMGIVSCVSDYLLSNNHINSIIVHKFDFSDEEVRFLVLKIRLYSLKLANI
jgi:hypothetical protein